MKKFLPFLAVIIVIVAIVGIALANKDNKNAATPPPAPTSNSNERASNNSSNTSSQNSQPSSTNSVSIANMSFSPSNITVKKGTTVTWTNNDSIAHTVTAKTNKEHGPNSGTLNPGKSYSFTFNDDGTFDYFCEIHPSMTGTVTVIE